ncbi:ATP-binding protein [Alteromonadaceae bacterium M269]|nr:ATP-binding protein [Alteromonadaceae bacterium M269]
MQKQSDISCKSCTSQLHQIRKTVKRACAEMAFDDEKTNSVVLAVDEACANVIRHSCNFSDKFKLKIEVYEEDGYGVFVISDNAPPISACAIEPKKIEQLEPGGLGLHLIYHVMDEVELMPPQGEGNRLKLSIKL